MEEETHVQRQQTSRRPSTAPVVQASHLCSLHWGFLQTPHWGMDSGPAGTSPSPGGSSPFTLGPEASGEPQEWACAVCRASGPWLGCSWLRVHDSIPANVCASGGQACAVTTRAGPSLSFPESLGVHGCALDRTAGLIRALAAGEPTRVGSSSDQCCGHGHSWETGPTWAAGALLRELGEGTSHTHKAPHWAAHGPHTRG